MRPTFIRRNLSSAVMAAIGIVRYLQFEKLTVCRHQRSEGLLDEPQALIPRLNK